jgi:hypothetical protein
LGQVRKPDFRLLRDSDDTLGRWIGDAKSGDLEWTKKVKPQISAFMSEARATSERTLKLFVPSTATEIDRRYVWQAANYGINLEKVVVKGWVFESFPEWLISSWW